MARYDNVKKNPVQLVGFKEFMQMTKDYPDDVKERIAKVGVTKAAARFRTLIRRASPILDGTLRKSINIRRAKKGRPLAFIGPTWPGGDNRDSYFGRLEHGYDKKHAWFAKAVEVHAPEILQMILTQAGVAVYSEAKKSYVKSLKKKWK